MRRPPGTEDLSTFPWGQSQQLQRTLPASMVADLSPGALGKVTATGDLEFFQAPTFCQENMDLAGGAEGASWRAQELSAPLQEEEFMQGVARGWGAHCRGRGGLSGKHGFHVGNKASEDGHGSTACLHRAPHLPSRGTALGGGVLGEPLYILVRVATVHPRAKAQNLEVLLASTPFQCPVCGLGLPDVSGVHCSSPCHQPRPTSCPPQQHPAHPQLQPSPCRAARRFSTHGYGHVPLLQKFYCVPRL